MSVTRDQYVVGMLQKYYDIIRISPVFTDYHFFSFRPLGRALPSR